MAFVDFFVYQSLLNAGSPETHRFRFRIACGDGRVCALCKHRWYDDEEGIERCSKLKNNEDLQDLPIGIANCNTVCGLFESEEEDDAEDEPEEEED